jgi:hypothetical protein
MYGHERVIVMPNMTNFMNDARHAVITQLVAHSIASITITHIDITIC